MFNIVVRHYFYLDGVEDSLAELLANQQAIKDRLEAMSEQLDRLTAAVERNTTVDQSIMTLMGGMAQQIRDLVANATELEETKAAMLAMADELDASSDAEAAAVVANTTAAPGGAPTPPTP